MIPLNNPDIAENEKRRVMKALDEGWLSTSGPEVVEFEKRVAEFCGSPFAVATNSGTSALHLSLRALGIGAGEHVLIPALAYVATQNAVMQSGASPIFIDVQEKDGQMDAGLLEHFLRHRCNMNAGQLIFKESGKRIAAIVPLWAWGDACAIGNIRKLADTFAIPLVEDAAAAFGSHVEGRHAGTFGRAGIISFNGNKIITTGGGGIVLTSDESLARRVKHLSLQAKVPDVSYLHDEMGFNDRMINLAAATGLGQLERFSEIQSNKIRIHQQYCDTFRGLGGLSIFPSAQEAGSVPNRWVFRIRTEKAELLYKHLRSRDIEAGRVWLPLNRLPMNAGIPCENPADNAWKIHSEVIALPSSSNLHEAMQDKVCRAVKEFFEG